jgi:hypothetical protein
MCAMSVKIIMLILMLIIPICSKETDEDTFEDTVPTVPSRLPTTATTPIPEVSDVSVADIRTTSVGIDPSLLIAQVSLTLNKIKVI